MIAPSATKNVPVNLSISLFIWASESMAVEEDNLAFNLEGFLNSCLDP